MQSLILTNIFFYLSNFSCFSLQFILAVMSPTEKEQHISITWWFGPVTGTIFLSMVTKCNPMVWHSTKYVTMFWVRLPFVMLSFGYSTKCNNTLVCHHSNNIVVTTTNTNTCAKCNTVVHNDICSTKCNNNDWSYPGNGAKCGTIVTVLLLWSYPGTGTKCFSR